MSTKTFFFKTKGLPWSTRIYSIKRRWSDEVLFYRISHYQSESVSKSTPNTAGRCKGILYLSALIPTTKNQWSRDISHLFKSPTVQLSFLLWACCENSKSIDPKKALLLLSIHSLKLLMNSGSFLVSKVLTAVWKHLFTCYKKSFRVSPVSFPPDIIRYVSDYSMVYITQLYQVYHISFRCNPSPWTCSRFHAESPNFYFLRYVPVEGFENVSAWNHNISSIRMLWVCFKVSKHLLGKLFLGEWANIGLDEIIYDADDLFLLLFRLRSTHYLLCTSITHL